MIVTLNDTRRAFVIATVSIMGMAVSGCENNTRTQPTASGVGAADGLKAIALRIQTQLAPFARPGSATSTLADAAQGFETSLRPLKQATRSVVDRTRVAMRTCPVAGSSSKEIEDAIQAIQAVREALRASRERLGTRRERGIAAVRDVLERGSIDVDIEAETLERLLLRAANKLGTCGPDK